MTPVNVVTRKVKPRTRGSMPIFGARATFALMDVIQSTLHDASKTPNAPPKPASSMLSVNNCLTRQNRPAPIALRTAISLCLAPARASVRLATFAHAINNTKPLQKAVSTPARSVLIRSHSTLPKRVADHRHRIRAWRQIVFGQERAPQRRVDSEEVEVVPRHHLTRSVLRSGAKSHARISVTVRRQRLQSLAAVAQVGVVRIRKGIELAPLRVLGVQAHYS